MPANRYYIAFIALSSPSFVSLLAATVVYFLLLKSSIAIEHEIDQGIQFYPSYVPAAINRRVLCGG